MEWSTPRRQAVLPVGFVKPCLPSVRAMPPRGREVTSLQPAAGRLDVG